MVNEISGWCFGTMEFYDFPYNILGTIIPTDELIFFRGVYIPPTSFSFAHKWKISMFCMFLCGLPKIDHVMIYDDIR
jgi:hypothetical protein